jgi:CDP-diglyceride synthetase
MSSLKSRVLVSVVGVPLLLWVVLGAPTFVIVAALCLLAGIGAVELQQCVSGERKSVLIALGAVAAVLTVACYHLCPQYVYILVIVELVTFFGYAIIKGGEVKFACVDGPEFDGHQVDFAELMSRNSTYRTREAEVTETHACRMEAMGKALIK